jgi:hypothetical protein
MTGRPKTRARGGRRPDDWWPGNTAALKSGAQSPRTIAPLAETFTAQLLQSAPWCDDPAFGGTVGSWAWTRAQIELLRAWINEHGMLDETGEPRSGHVLLDRLEARLDILGEHLALTPRAKVALGIDLAIQRNTEVEGRILAEALDVALGVLDALPMDAGERDRLHEAAIDRVHAHLAGLALPELPAAPAAEPVIPDAEIIAAGNEIVIESDDDLADALARTTSSPVTDDVQVRTGAGPAEDASQANVRDEAGTPAESTDDDAPSPVVPLRKNPNGHNPMPDGPNPWRRSSANPWMDPIFDPRR